jgi:hypothetical protein
MGGQAFLLILWWPWCALAGNSCLRWRTDWGKDDEQARVPAQAAFEDAAEPAAPPHGPCPGSQRPSAMPSPWGDRRVPREWGGRAGVSPSRRAPAPPNWEGRCPAVGPHTTAPVPAVLPRAQPPGTGCTCQAHDLVLSPLRRGEAPCAPGAVAHPCLASRVVEQRYA